MECSQSTRQESCQMEKLCEGPMFPGGMMGHYYYYYYLCMAKRSLLSERPSYSYNIYICVCVCVTI
jgi:hypothetical protein